MQTPAISPKSPKAKQMFRALSTYLAGILATVFLVVMLPQSVRAADETSAAYLQANRFKKGTLLLLKDNKVYGPNGYNGNWQNQFDIKRTDNLLSLMINPAASSYGKNSFTVKLDLKLFYKNAQDKIVKNENGKDTTELSLKVGYNLNDRQAYKQQDLYHFTGGHYVEVKVANVSIAGTDTTSLTNLVMLKSEIRVERYYSLSSQKVNNLSHSFQAQDNELKLTWDAMQGAEEYEVEYTFVDNYEYNPSSGLQSPGKKGKLKVNYNFDENSQRVRLDENHYTIPLVYEQGYLVYRVRPLGRGGDNFDKTVYGKWSLPASNTVATAMPHAYTIDGGKIQEQDRKNWLYQSAFTEDGRRHISMSYFDGSNRQRQTLTKNASEGFTLVEETLYDYEGREAVQVMPAPVATKNPSAAIRYYPQFNQNQQGEKYSKKDFDVISSGGCGPEKPAPMDEASGAARYYSSKNNMPSQFTEHLPKANGYPFSQTQYEPTENNLPSRKSMPGEKLQLGSGHEEEYFYTTSPMQIELDRMLGSEAGKAQHYRKVVVFDANDQAHVKYIDNQGNVVANGLVGAPPANLKQLPEDQVDQATLSGEILQSSNERQGLSWTASHQFVVTTANTDYTFRYKLNPSELQKNLCDGESICYDGIYDVSITLQDDCGNVLRDTTARVGDLTNIDGNCDNYGPLEITLNSGPLQTGNYMLSKTLSLNEEALKAYVDSFANESCLQTVYDSIYNEEKRKANMANCLQGCGGMEASRIYRDTLPNGEVITDTLSEQEQSELQARINNACEGEVINMCQSGYDMLLTDVTPGGQYAQYYDNTKVLNDDGDSVAIGFKPSNFPLSMLNRSNKLPGSKANWKHPTRPYRDTTGDLSWLKIGASLSKDSIEGQVTVRNGEEYVKPQQLKYTRDFVEFWQDSWAKSLVEYHPEYCYYAYCSNHPQSNKFDGSLLATASYNAAVDSGFMQSGTPDLLDQDPFFQQYPNLKTEMQDTLTNMVQSGNVSFSLTEVVISMHHGCGVFNCGQQGNSPSRVVQCVQNHKPLFAGKDSSLQTQLWRSYRSIYMAMKRTIIERERHEYAINDCGVYNGCIGMDNDIYVTQDQMRMQEMLQGGGNIQANQPCNNAQLYEEKQKRFPDGDDLYDYMEETEAPSELANSETEAENLKNFAENYMKRECDKCPQEAKLETFLNELAINDKLTQQGATANQALASCDLVDRMNLPVTANGYLWKASTTGGELTGTIYHGTNDFCTIKMMDTADVPVDWNNILMFTCMQHISSPEVYNPQQGGNFKIRAVTKDREVAWLEGTISCMQLQDCQVPNYCQTNETAEDLLQVFNRTFGYYPLIRKLMLETGRNQLASRIPVHPGTQLVVDGVDITNQMTDALKQGHKQSTTADRKYFWQVDSITPDSNALVAGIFTKEGCRFNMYADSAHKLNKPFVVTDVVVNHPYLETEGCEQQEFMLIARYIKINRAQTPALSHAAANTQSGVSFGKPFRIMVNSECYSVAECCQEKDCPEQTANGEFSDGNQRFASGLPYAETTRKGGFYALKNSFKGAKSGPGKFQIDPGQLDLPVNPQITPNTFNQEQTEESEPDTSTQVPAIMNVPSNQLPDAAVNLQETLQNAPQLPTSQMLQIDPGQVKARLPLLQQNNYLIFKPSGAKTHTVWKQEMPFEGNTSYTIRFNVKLEKGTDAFNASQTNWSQLLQWQVGSTSGSFTAAQVQADGEWVTLSGTYQAQTNATEPLAIQFAGNKPYHKQMWAVDAISVQAENCKNPMCCPPIMPKIPPEAYENPCVDMKRRIAKENAETIYDEFVRDTLRSIKQAYIEAAMDVDESMEKEFSTYTYKMTLHYYDQTGNLVKTVPPKGYNPLSTNRARQVDQNRKSGNNNAIQPGHTMTTTYQYNSLDEVIKKTTPDGGTTRYWYDKLGRIVASQNAEQKRVSDKTGGPNNSFSYMLYDELGRIIETGKLTSAAKMSHQIAKNKNSFNNWLQGAQKREIKRVYYDEPLAARINNYFGNNGQGFLRKRVATSTYDVTDQDDGGNIHQSYDYAAHYSYDVHGNVKTVLREFPELAGMQQSLKRIDYQYDLLSGNITQISYQKGQPDQFIHRYQYDADNRLISVKTSRNDLAWQNEARYYYYPHGSLARIELGEEHVQGIDYAYTLQGWMKGINSGTASPTEDMGKDAVAAANHAHIAADAAGYGMQYFSNDYQAAGASAGQPFRMPGSTGNSGKDLYNGNISRAVSGKAGQNQALAMAYRYDQMGRLVQMQAFKETGGSFQTTQDYQASFAYDANGNLTDVMRNGATAEGPQQMDDMTYNYRPGTNQIDHIADQVPDAGYDNDLDNQSSGNYNYDAAGRLTADKQAGIQSIAWNHNHKITNVQKGNQSIAFAYGPLGKRIKKEAPNRTEFYVRGPNHRVMAKYHLVNDTFKVAQFNIYGQKRLGTLQPNEVLAAKQNQQGQSGLPGNFNINRPELGQRPDLGQLVRKGPVIDTFSVYRGYRQYELNNHLDNVLATVSDRKMRDTAGSHFRPVLLSASDYYPYGMTMPGRTSGNNYLYGFNGKEKDNSLLGESNTYNFGARMYDARTGRWMSMDPKRDSFPDKSPYLSMSGNPINRFDPDGKQDKDSKDSEEEMYTNIAGKAIGWAGADYLFGIEVNPWINEEWKEKNTREIFKKNLQQSKKTVAAMRMAAFRKGGFDSKAYKKLRKLEDGLDEALTKIEKGNKVIDMVDKASSVMKIAEAWNKIDPTDTSKKGRRKRAKQFDIIFEHSGSIMSEFTEYGAVVEQAGKNNFFSNMSHYQHYGNSDKRSESIFRGEDPNKPLHEIPD